MRFQKDVLTYLVDDVVVGETHIPANRYLKVYELAEDGSMVKIWMSCAYDTTNHSMFHPKKRYKEVIYNAGFVPMLTVTVGTDPLLAKTSVETSDLYCQWQARTLNYLIKNGEYEIIFSHLHNIDNCGHLFWHLGKERADVHNDETYYQQLIQEVYAQTDRYIGEFLYLLDEGWTIFIVDCWLLRRITYHCSAMVSAAIFVY